MNTKIFGRNGARRFGALEVAMLIAAVVIMQMMVLTGRAAPGSLIAPNGYTSAGWSGVGTAQGTTNSFFVVSAYAAETLPAYTTVAPRPLTPIVRFLDVSSDSASSKVQFYSLSNQVFVLFTNNSTTCTVSTTNQFVAADVLLGRHVGSDTYERMLLSSIAGATNSAATNSYFYTLTFAWAPATQWSTNDLIYRAKAWGSVTVGNTNNLSIHTWHPGFMYVGQPGLPLLFELNNGTSTSTINCAAGDYR